MSVREIGWGLFLAGLPFAHFFLAPEKLNQWHAQTLWAQAWLVLLFGISLGETKRVAVRNLPLGCWMAWVGLSVVWIWMYYLVREQQHPIGLLPPFLHCLCLGAFYLAATTQWTPALVNRLLTWVAYSGLFIVAYGVLQLINFDQFYRWLDWSKKTDTLIGTIGNPTHFGTHLALLLPIFLWQKQWWWRIVAAVSVILLVLTRSTSAILCGYAVVLWWAWQELPRGAWVSLVVAGVCAGVLLLRSSFWSNPSGRLETWAYLWQHYLVGDGQQQIPGAGLGRVMEDSMRNLNGWPAKWHHAHNEYFQVLIEQGVIGMGLVFWGIVHAIRTWWRLPLSPVSNTLAGIGVAFLLASLVNFPAHLWVLASLWLLAYCGTYVLAAEGEGA